MKLDRIIAVRNRKTIYRDGELCMKVFDASYSMADVLGEALNQARVGETSLNVPAVREVAVIDGKAAIISDFIRGKTLAQLLHDEPERRDELLSLLATLQTQIHSESCPQLESLRDKLARKLLCTDFDATTRYDLHSRLDAMPRQGNLCHGDFEPENVIIAEDGTPYIIDWSHASKGNPAADAARTYQLLCLSGDTEGAKRYLELFCNQNGIDERSIWLWMPIVAAAQTLSANEEERSYLCTLVGSGARF